MSTTAVAMNRLPQWVVDHARDQMAQGAFVDHYTAVLDHDTTCTSLHNVWLPRLGGVGGCDIESCSGCELIFADYEGLMFVELPCGAAMHLCECCTR